MNELLNHKSEALVSKYRSKPIWYLGDCIPGFTLNHFSAKKSINPSITYSLGILSTSTTYSLCKMHGILAVKCKQWNGMMSWEMEATTSTFVRRCGELIDRIRWLKNLYAWLMHYPSGWNNGFFPYYRLSWTLRWSSTTSIQSNSSISLC